MSTVEEPRRIVRFFTSTRRVPLMIGKAGGTRLLGGPYTVAQLVIGATVLVGGYQTMSIWGPLVGRSPLTRIAVLVVLTIIAALASGQIPSSKRKLHHLASDAMGAATESGSGTYDGRAVKLPPPHFYGGDVLLSLAEDDLPAQPAEQSPTVAAAPPSPAPVAVPAAASAEGRPTTGLDRLLAQARGKDL